jgi:hypothetical protein
MVNVLPLTVAVTGEPDKLKPAASVAAREAVVEPAP